MTTSPKRCPGHLNGFPRECGTLEVFFAHDDAAVDANAFLSARDAIGAVLATRSPDAFAIASVLRRWLGSEKRLGDPFVMFEHPVLLPSIAYEPLRPGEDPIVNAWLATARAGECEPMQARRRADLAARTEIWEILRSRRKSLKLKSLRDGRIVDARSPQSFAVGDDRGGLVLARVYEGSDPRIGAMETAFLRPEFADEVRATLRTGMTALETFEAFYFVPGERAESGAPLH